MSRQVPSVLTDETEGGDLAYLIPVSQRSDELGRLSPRGVTTVSAALSLLLFSANSLLHVITSSFSVANGFVETVWVLLTKTGCL
jgi:hypothetical protein